MQIPDEEYVPVAHVWQTDNDVPFCTVEPVPGRHSVQANAPNDDQVPFGQPMHELFEAK